MASIDIQTNNASSKKALNLSISKLEVVKQKINPEIIIASCKIKQLFEKEDMINQLNKFLDEKITEIDNENANTHKKFIIVVGKVMEDLDYLDESNKIKLRPICNLYQNSNKVNFYNFSIYSSTTAYDGVNKLGDRKLFLKRALVLIKNNAIISE